MTRNEVKALVQIVASEVVGKLGSRAVLEKQDECIEVAYTSLWKADKLAVETHVDRDDVLLALKTAALMRRRNEDL